MGLPPTDGTLLSSQGLMFFALHLMLYTVAFVIVRVYAAATYLVLFILGAIMRFLFHR